MLLWCLICVHPMQYDYSLERRITEQAKHRALSIAAEASLQKKQVLALQQQLAGGGGSDSSREDAGSSPRSTSQSHLPFNISSTDILTPTPVAPPTTSQQSSTTITSNAGQSNDVSQANSQPLLATSSNNSSDAIFKSLGNWSIKEFEGDVMDPFEITSLQAINDMEELQSVLLPLTSTAPPPPPAVSAAPPPPVSTAPSPATTSAVAVASATPPLAVSVLPSAVTLPSASTSSSSSLAPLPHTNPFSRSAATIQSPVLTPPITNTVNVTTGPLTTLSSNSSPELSALIRTTPQLPSSNPTEIARNNSSNHVLGHSAGNSPVTSSLLLTQTNFLPQQAPHASTNPFIGSGLPPLPPITTTIATTNSAVTSNNPFLSGGAVTAQQQQQDHRHSEPGVGTLVDLTTNKHAPPQQQELQPKPPVPAPRTSPKVSPGGGG